MKDIPDNNSITVAAHRKNLHAIRTFVHTQACRASFSDAECAHIELAIDEVCANVIEHNYKDDENERLTVAIDFDPDKFYVTITDNGEQFNPTEAKLPNLQQHAHEYRTRGLGIYLMTKVMNEIHYEYKNNEINCLELIKYIRHDSIEEAALIEEAEPV